MTAIQASFVKVAGTLQDGTLRLLIDIEPADATAAFELFHLPGTPMAIAALKTGYAQSSSSVVATPETRPQDSTADSAHLKHGPLCWEAITLCQNPEFQKWIVVHYKLPGGEPCGVYLRQICGVDSRTEFDTDKAKGQIFIERIRLPFMRRNHA